MNCRSCGSAKMEKVFSLGEVPLANHLLSSPDEPYEKFPLDLWVCEYCTLAQLGELVPPEKMFSDYLYLTSYSPEMVKQAEEIALRMIRRGLSREPLVIEIGSNDGYLLQHYLRRGIPVLGIDPSYQASMNAQVLHKIPTITKYFTEELAETIVAGAGQADAVHANNVLAHVPDPNGFLRGVKKLLKPDGVAVIEVGYAGFLTVDQIYHEHVCYFSERALMNLAERNGLCVNYLEHIPVHGGSLRAFMGHRGSWQATNADVNWSNFAFRAQKAKDALNEMLGGFDEQNVVGFGAAAKTTVLCNYLGETGIAYVVDDNPLKQGKWIPGTCIPVNAPEFMEESKPDYLLIFTWNYAKQVMERFPRFKGKFILPMPTPVVL